MPVDPKCSVLGILGDLQVENFISEAITRALFQALILVHWKSQDPPTHAELVKSIGNMLQLESYVGNFEKNLGLVSGDPGLGPTDLIVDRILL